MHPQDKQAFFAVAVLASVLLGWALVPGDEIDDAQIAHNHHCKMVAAWEADKAQGITEWARDGWPNYDGRECE